ncbi:prepilin peptidase [bacterium]|nr:prepilin peptidase [bacterium]
MILLLIGILGLLFGSFFNVVIHRLPKKQSLSKPGSHCPQCGSAVRWVDNVPILSYIILAGRCRVCRVHIPFRYPLVEALTALGFVALYLKFGISHDFGRYVILYAFLVPLAFIDWDRKLILNNLTLPCTIIGILYILIFDIANWKTMIFGGLAGALILVVFALLGQLLFKKESMGMGDVKLLALAGIYLGFPQVLYALFLGMIIAAIYIIVGLTSKNIDRESTIPFGPFIAIGVLGQLLVGETILVWYIGLIR